MNQRKLKRSKMILSIIKKESLK